MVVLDAWSAIVAVASLADIAMEQLAWVLQSCQAWSQCSLQLVVELQVGVLAAIASPESCLLIGST